MHRIIQPEVQGDGGGGVSNGFSFFTQRGLLSETLTPQHFQLSLRVHAVCSCSPKEPLQRDALPLVCVGIRGVAGYEQIVSAVTYLPKEDFK